MANKKEIVAGIASAAAVIATASAASAADAGMLPDTWSGFYAGVSAGIMSGDLPFHRDSSTLGTYALNSSAVVPGAFAGFNYETGKLVLGAELGVQLSTPVQAVKGVNTGKYGLNNTLDAKAKIGYDLGKFMVYGFAGATSQSVAGSDRNTYNAFGFNFGAGLDAKVTEHISIGAEYMRREMQGFNRFTNTFNAFGENELALRASYHF